MTYSAVPVTAQLARLEVETKLALFVSTYLAGPGPRYALFEHALAAPTDHWLSSGKVGFLTHASETYGSLRIGGVDLAKRASLGKIGVCYHLRPYPRRLSVSSIPEDLLVSQAGDPDALTKLLNLPELAVTCLERAAGRHALFLHCRVLADLASCPTGQHLTDRIPQLDRRTVCDRPGAGSACYRAIRTRRCWCAPGQRPVPALLAAGAPHARSAEGGYQTWAGLD